MAREMVSVPVKLNEFLGRSKAQRENLNDGNPENTQMQHRMWIILEGKSMPVLNSM